ncbi:hypothetical protein BMEI0314 [Brucella melitensis bv. 1 str. 16M]|uniref:Uncharacterized protein n=1 Tax=Brucella melitensis biotype 1 (strain ATCC 23456 / CCUG 17765 / NCTC 10094 / 16M) TaxID=224914 RepID=Q8YIX5_BRUME|nr:hypothetical protein BMEI0314 [Brucella melitensis bv. 1 str. 16M]
MISKGAVPVKACGLSHMAPTYFVGSRDQSLPSAVVVAAFSFFFKNMFLRMVLSAVRIAFLQSLDGSPYCRSTAKIE